MKKDFKQWKDDYGLEFEPNYSKETELDCKAAFEAGQQSKQAEVDELQKRIDDITHKLKNIKNDTLRSHRYDYDKGWRDCAITTLNDLKGNTNDH